MKSLLTISFLLQAVTGLNILMGNDDGFGASNIREFYRLLVASGHNVYMVAPATDQSGMGGRFVTTTVPTLTGPSEFNLVPAGAPSLGQDPMDNHIWYYNGTPAACTLVGLDVVLPTFANFSVPGLFVSGPNFGNNIGTFAFTGSGTIGATYTAIERNIPVSPMPPIPSTYAAQQAVRLVNQIAKNTKAGQRIFPLGYGLNVNFPTLNSSCMSPSFTQSRFGGSSAGPKLFFNATSGLVGIVNNNYYNVIADGANTCINGNCSLPGESNVVKGCATAVTIFTVDYDAPSNSRTAMVEQTVFDKSSGSGTGWGDW